MKLAEIETKRTAKLVELQSLIDVRDTEAREFTAEEKPRFDALAAEVVVLNADYDREKKIDDLNIQKIKNRSGKNTPEGQAAKIYSISKAVNQLAGNRPMDGLELEMDQEAEREFTQIGKGSSGNLRIPSFMMKVKGKNVIGQQRDLTAAGAATGDELVEDLNVGHIFGLNIMPKVMQLGATVLTGLTGDVHFTKTGVATAVWAAAENTASTETTPGTYRVSMTPKRVTAFTDLSKTLLTQKPGFVDAWIQRELEVATNVLFDATAINGAGSGGAPTGILNFGSGVNSVAMGTDGGTPTRAKLIEMETLIAEDNAGDLGSMSYLTTPGIRGYLKGLATDTGSGLFVWGGDNNLVGYPAYASNNVPSTLTKGASAGNCHAIILAVWDQLLIGQWGGMDITVDPFSRSKEFIVTLVINSLWDINARHLQAFCHMKDAKTS